MQLSRYLNQTLSWLAHTIWFFKNHFLVIFSLGLVAAFGRAIQLGAFGPVSDLPFILLEIVIEMARILIFLYALGFTNIKTGFLRIKHVCTSKENFRKNWAATTSKLKQKWVTILVNMVAFLAIAFVINYLIDLLAYQTCLYAKLKASQVINDQSSEWTIILFFKNISVIPFTLVFNALFLLWITNKQTNTSGYLRKK